METTLLIKTKKDLKDKAQNVAKEMGIPLSIAINAFLKQFSEEKTLTLTTKGYEPTPYLEQIIKKASIDYKNKKDISPVFTNVKDAISWLKK